MIKLSYGHIDNPYFNEVVEKIDNFKGLSDQTLSDFIKFKKVWDTEKKKAQIEMTNLLREHVQRDRKGNPIVSKKKMSLLKRLVGRKAAPPEGSRSRFVFKDEAKFSSDAGKLLSTEFEIPIGPFEVKAIQKVGLSPKELSTISVLLKGEADGSTL